MTADSGGAATRFGAVIFDMDGVLTDSEPAFHAAVNDILARYGESISLHDYEGFIGTATPVMWERMIALKRLPAPLDEILQMYEAPLMERLRQPRPPLPGARELLERLRARARADRAVHGVVPALGGGDSRRGGHRGGLRRDRHGG